jgi:hypothetical protein
VVEFDCSTVDFSINTACSLVNVRLLNTVLTVSDSSLSDSEVYFSSKRSGKVDGRVGSSSALQMKLSCKVFSSEICADGKFARTEKTAAFA